MMTHQFMKLVLEAKLHRLDKFPHQCFFLIFTPKCVPLDICLSKFNFLISQLKHKLWVLK